MRLATVGIIFVGAASLLCAAGSASAGLVTWEFTGELTGIHDTDGSLGDLFNPGMPFSGQYTFDSTTQDTNSDPGFGIYAGALQSISGFVGGIPFQALPTAGVISVRNNPLGLELDNYEARGLTELLGEAATISVSLGDSLGVAFSDDSLMAVPPVLSLFDSTTFTIEFAPDGDALFGKLTSLTPEPGTVTLLVLGTITLCRRRSCR